MMGINQVWQIFAVGFAVLIGAIIINMLANVLGITTWYGLLNNIKQLGFLDAFSKESIVSIIFLFIVYPFLLGCIGYYLTKVIA